MGTTFGKLIYTDNLNWFKGANKWETNYPETNPLLVAQ
jgi:hypothetical protein